jgi:hypothetical protein
LYDHSGFIQYISFVSLKAQGLVRVCRWVR